MSSNWYFWLFKQSTLTVKTQPTSVFFKALTFGKVQIFKFIHVSETARGTSLLCNATAKTKSIEVTFSLPRGIGLALYTMLFTTSWSLWSLVTCASILSHIRCGDGLAKTPSNARRSLLNSMLLPNQVFGHVLQERWSLASSPKSLQKGKFQCLFCGNLLLVSSAGCFPTTPSSWVGGLKTSLSCHRSCTESCVKDSPRQTNHQWLQLPMTPITCLASCLAGKESRQTVPEIAWNWCLMSLWSFHVNKIWSFWRN